MLLPKSLKFGLSDFKRPDPLLSTRKRTTENIDKVKKSVRKNPQVAALNLSQNSIAVEL